MPLPLVFSLAGVAAVANSLIACGLYDLGKGIFQRANKKDFEKLFTESLREAAGKSVVNEMVLKKALHRFSANDIAERIKRFKEDGEHIDNLYFQERLAPIVGDKLSQDVADKFLISFRHKIAAQPELARALMMQHLEILLQLLPKYHAELRGDHQEILTILRELKRDKEGKFRMEKKEAGSLTIQAKDQSSCPVFRHQQSIPSRVFFGCNITIKNPIGKNLAVQLSEVTCQDIPLNIGKDIMGQEQKSSDYIRTSWPHGDILYFHNSKGKQGNWQIKIPNAQINQGETYTISGYGIHSFTLVGIIDISRITPSINKPLPVRCRFETALKSFDFIIEFTYYESIIP